MFSNLFKKTTGEYVLIFLIAVIAVIIYYIQVDYFDNLKKSEPMISINVGGPTWNRTQCDYSMNQTIIDELKNNGLVQSDKDWNVYFPCAYDEITKEVNQMPVVNGGKYFILENCDEIVAKELLWKNVVKHYGMEKAKIIMPNSYTLYNIDDIDRFNREFSSDKLYIMKKNIQRQEGLKITKDKNEILNGYKSDGYVIVQELLQDPYLISGRKTNMRFYVLVVCKGDELNVFVYNDGFMYYTKDSFVVSSAEDGPNITTGYINRQVYDNNPLTHGDLRNYLDDENRKDLLDCEKNIRAQGLKVSEIYFNRIYHMIREVFIAFSGKLTGEPKSRRFNNTNIQFQIFGVDVGVNNQLNPMIIEVNKGPDLGAKDERDSQLKHGVVKDTFKIIGLINGQDYTNTNFIKVLDVGNGAIITDSVSGCSI
jgi:hypothetical protein